MEYTREKYFRYYRDTNKHATDRKFETLKDLLDFLSDQDEDGETIVAVKEWLFSQGETGGE